MDYGFGAVRMGLVVASQTAVVHQPASWVGRVDDARPPPREGLRTAHPALRDPDTWAAITLMTRRLARKGATPSWPRKPAPANG